MLLQQLFFRRYGARRPNHLIKPNVFRLERFMFPKNSLWHFIQHDSDAVGPDVHDRFLREYTKKIYVEHAQDITSHEGGPVKLGIPLMKFIRKFHIENKRFRISNDISQGPADEMTMAIVNYSLLKHKYRYPRSIYANYYRWRNIEKTVWDRMHEIAKTDCTRTQYYFVKLPKRLPSYQRLNIAAQKFSVNVLRKFVSVESLFLLEFWKWLSEHHRTESIIGNWSHEEMEKVNIVFIDEDRFFIHNLGLLDSYRYIKGVYGDETQKIKLHPDQMQKRFLRSIMYVMGMRDGNDNEVVDTLKGLMDKSASRDSSDTAIASTDAPDNKYTDIANIPDEIEEDLESKKIIENMINNLDEDLDILEDIDIDEDMDNVAKGLDEAEQEGTIVETKVYPDPEDIQSVSEIRRIKDKPNLDKGRVVKEVTRVLPDTNVSYKDFDKPVEVVEQLRNTITNLGKMGSISPANVKAKTEALNRLERTPAPMNRKQSLIEYTKINPEDLKVVTGGKNITLPNEDIVPDKTMLNSSLIDFDKDYIEKVMEKDIASMCLNAQKGGFIINDYEVETIEDVTGKYRTHTLRVTPLSGKDSTLRFKMPVVESDGTFMTGGNKYRVRKQRRDKPIRKINRNLVELFTYYSRVLVNRTERHVNNYGVWLHNNISALSLIDNPRVRELHTMDVFDGEFRAPRTYTAIAKHIKSFKYEGFELCFNHKDREEIFGSKAMLRWEKNGSILIGIRADNSMILMDKNSAIYQIHNGDLKPLGTIEDWLKLDTTKQPIEFAEVGVLNEKLPVGIVLGYLLGLTNLIKLLKADVRKVLTGQRLNLQSHEYALKFSDETLIFNKEEPVASMILSGFSMYKDAIKNYSVYNFDTSNVYLNIIESKGINVRYLKELNLMNSMYVDPISEEILRGMGEPTTFTGLLVRACELLSSDYYKNALDMEEMRICGYERMAGAVYSELVKSMRIHNSKVIKTNSSIELNPFAVWKFINEDPAKITVDELNPVINLKEIEAVTFNGNNGRSSQAMNRADRRFHPHDTGVISESTVDSGEVAVNTYMVPDPQFTSLRGTTAITDLSVAKGAKLASTSAMLSPACDQDSAQRVNMIGIQQAHSIACEGYETPAIRTGYEHVLAQRVSSTFAKPASKSGTVVSIDKHGMKVKYDDGTEESFTIGRSYGKSASLIVPHDLVPNFKVGEKFNAGDVLMYNDGFFAPDPFMKGSVIWKNYIIARVALMETRQTHEDACAISQKLAEKMRAKTTKIKEVVIEFKQSVREIRREGETVSHDDVLCYIEDQTTADAGMFNADTLDTLKRLSGQSPRAKVDGVIERIEVYYNGDPEDMSESLRAITLASDAAMAKRARQAGKPPLTGATDSSYRVKGNPLQLDTLVIRFFITGEVIAGVGDKGVFSNQLKTVISEVMDYDVETESGLPVDAIFGAQSVFNRIVNSAFVIGTTNTLLDIIGKKAAEIYFDKK